MLDIWSGPFYKISRYMEDFFPTIISFVGLYVINVFGSKQSSDGKESPFDSGVVSPLKNTFGDNDKSDFSS